MRIIGLILWATSLSALAVPLEDAVWFENRSADRWPCVYEENNPAWEAFDLPVRTSRAVNLKRGPMVLSARFPHEQDGEQGLVVLGQAGAKVFCNGKVLEPVVNSRSEPIFALPLVKGNNSLSIRLPASTNKKASIFLTPVDLDYVKPTAKSQLEALRRSIDYLEAQDPAYAAETFRKQIKVLLSQPESPEVMEQIRVLQIEALVKNNPALDFDEILLRRSKRANHPPNWKGNTGIPKEGYGNEIAKLSLKDFSLSTVFQPKGGSTFVGDINLRYDAKKMLISSVSTADKTWQVFELNSDGTGLRQVTQSAGADIDNYNGNYLPDGSLIFCSTANMTGIPCIGGRDNVGTLYKSDMNGAGVHQLTFEQDADWYPWVMDDGKVMYLRWEYTDNSHYFTRILMTMNPDGTQQRSIYGSNSYWPSSLFYAKNIPGSNSRFVAIVSGHHGINREGELVLFDAGQGEKDTEGVVQRIPGFGKKVENIIRDKYAVGNWPRFLHPYPLSDTYFLAAGRLSPNHKWGIYLLDRFDNIVLLKEDELSLFEPVPFKPRPMPHVIPSRVREGAGDAVLYIQDIYEGPGLAGIPRGTVKQLRLLTYGYAYRNMGGHDSITIEGGWDAKRVLGTVPVEEDGSVMVRVPHSTPISIQPTDENGAALQLMRSWLTAMPGESLSCVGCHESARTAPLPRATLAMRKGPQPLVPLKKEKVHGFSFLRDVQPVLDRRCVGCHDGKDADRPNFKSLEPIKRGREFAGSYHALHPFVRRPGCESDFDLLTPMDYHVSTSELFQLLEKGHHGVVLDQNDRNMLTTWVDLNIPYYANWTDRYGEKRVDGIATRARELRKEYTGIDEDSEWAPIAPTERPAFMEPKKPEVTLPAAPKTLKYAPDPSAGKDSQTVDLGNGMSIILRRIPMGDKIFWMAEGEITNRQFQQFDSKHNSRFIDQQWKDHVYPGYPANEPQMPVIRVSQNEAMAFCAWLSKKTGKQVTLPTEEQWEWACRAGSAEPFFFGGSGFEKYANLADASIGQLAVHGVDPQAVGQKQRSLLNDFVPRDDTFNDGRLVPDGTKQYEPNPWGLYDMHGNVAEWTRSNYDENRKVVRGGSWRDRPARATASYRLGYPAYQRVFNVGFRILIEE